MVLVTVPSDRRLSDGDDVFMSVLSLCFSAYQQTAYVQQPHQQTAYVQQPHTVLVQQQHQKKKGGMGGGLGKMAVGEFCLIVGCRR